MAKIFDFNHKPEAKKFKEFHHMWASHEDHWIIWRCYTCSRKVKFCKDSNKFVVERKGNFNALHNSDLEQV
jgi:hypothetical protein